jgi:formate hydrogenlyase subunit 3/multisubunit Na+/H+ antiporter MnhD subunit
MVIALAVFLPLLGAFLSVWMAHRKPGLSLLVSQLFLAGGLISTIILSLKLDAWSLRNLGESIILRTGVGAPPLSINLEATAGAVIAAIAVYAAAMLGIRRFASRNAGTIPLLLSLVTASLGLLFATDLFNSFVFFEIGSIVTIGLIAACKCRRRWEVSVKVTLVSGLVTILYLLAVVIVYRTTGELRLEALGMLHGIPAILVSALMLTVIMTEIKAFPLSGWGLDLYQGASPGFTAVYSSTWSLAVLMWSARVLPILPLPDPAVLAWIGAAGLILGQLAGLRTKSPGRMLGYSSAAYASVLLILAGTTTGNDYILLTLVLMVFAALAKFTIFMSANPGEDGTWRGVSGILLLLPVLMIIGIPPLPVFWVKFRFLSILSDGPPLLLASVITGLFLEAVYLLRLWSWNLKPSTENRKPAAYVAPIIMMAATVWFTESYWSQLDFSSSLIASPVLRILFMMIFAGGILMNFPGACNRLKGERSYWFWMLLSGAALLLLPMSGNGLTFYVLWEISAFAAVVAVSRGNKASRATFWFSVFAAASGFLLLASTVLSDTSFTAPGIPALLAAAAALFKLGQMGTHLWTVKAYSKAPATMPAFLAGTSSKAAVLLLLIVSLGSGSVPSGSILAWIGVLTALGMAVMAALSSDYKKVLAYASVSQMGYILAGIGLASVIGWTAAFYHTFHHFLFKTVLFLGAAGVIWRTGTSDYNRLGGLIKTMPLTFAFTLVSVISFAGVPPLAGFGGKWLLYNALIEAGWLPIALVAMFASVVAFLYAFRLLYAVFLGQLSPKNSSTREAPLTLLLPQALLTVLVMVLSFRPTLFLNRVVPAVESLTGLRGSAPVIEGTLVSSSLGTWDAWSVGMMVVGIFGFAFVFYWISGRKPKHVGQLDIGFSGELPPSAEEVHYAGEFYRPYMRALSFLPRIHAGRIFRGITEVFNIAGDTVRALFTGDARTYLAHSLIFLVLFFILLKGGI